MDLSRAAGRAAAPREIATARSSGSTSTHSSAAWAWAMLPGPTTTAGMPASLNSDASVPYATPMPSGSRPRRAQRRPHDRRPGAVRRRVERPVHDRVGVCHVQHGIRGPEAVQHGEQLRLHRVAVLARHHPPIHVDLRGRRTMFDLLAAANTFTDPTAAPVSGWDAVMPGNTTSSSSRMIGSMALIAERPERGVGGVCRHAARPDHAPHHAVVRDDHAQTGGLAGDRRGRPPAERRQMRVHEPMDARARDSLIHGEQQRPVDARLPRRERPRMARERDQHRRAAALGVACAAAVDATGRIGGPERRHRHALDAHRVGVALKAARERRPRCGRHDRSSASPLATARRRVTSPSAAASRSSRSTRSASGAARPLMWRLTELHAQHPAQQLADIIGIPAQRSRSQRPQEVPSR